MARIELTALSHRYEPSIEAVSGVDLALEDGGAYALLGPSGCGKTTLLGIVSGLLRPTAGKVFFDGVDVTALDPRRRNIAQVFQLPVVYEAMSVADNLAFPLRNRGVDAAAVRRRVAAVAEILEIDGLLSARAVELPPDQRQRVCLGRGLVREDVAAVLLDEPMSAIDPHQRWRLRRTLKRVHAELGITMVYVTHDQEEALTFADQVIVLEQGRMMQVGPPESLFERPEHAFVGTFLGSPGMNLLEAAVADGGLQISGIPVAIDAAVVERAASSSARLQLGIRPERLLLSATEGLPATVERVRDLGTHRLAEISLGSNRLIARTEHHPLPGPIRLGLPAAACFVYADGELVRP